MSTNSAPPRFKEVKVKFQFLLISVSLTFAASVHAQPFGGGCGAPGIGGGCNVYDDGSTPGDEITSTANSATDIDNQAQTIAGIEQQNIRPGEAGGFDWAQTLQGDLEQQVSSAGGMPLVTGAISAYSTYWPGYSNAGYLQGPPPPGSPEANTSTTLGTLQGALQAGADQQQSQQAEATRMENLENEAGNASGNLQVQEVSNEITLFNAQEEMKQRNATNGTLNALLIAESNRQNQKAQDDLESMAVAGASVPWSFANNPNPPEPRLPTE
jgi:hypothetical protein